MDMALAAVIPCLVASRRNVVVLYGIGGLSFLSLDLAVDTFPSFAELALSNASFTFLRSSKRPFLCLALNSMSFLSCASISQ